jgi:hypothetical protein
MKQDEKPDDRLIPQCSTWDVSFLGSEKNITFNHVLQNIGAERTTRWIVKAIKAQGGVILNVTENKNARAMLDVSSRFGVRPRKGKR